MTTEPSSTMASTGNAAESDRKRKLDTFAEDDTRNTESTATMGGADGGSAGRAVDARDSDAMNEDTNTFRPPTSSYERNESGSSSSSSGSYLISPAAKRVQKEIMSAPPSRRNIFLKSSGATWDDVADEPKKPSSNTMAGPAPSSTSSTFTSSAFSRPPPIASTDSPVFGGGLSSSRSTHSSSETSKPAQPPPPVRFGTSTAFGSSSGFGTSSFASSAGKPPSSLATATVASAAPTSFAALASFKPAASSFAAVSGSQLPSAFGASTITTSATTTTTTTTTATTASATSSFLSMAATASKAAGAAAPSSFAAASTSFAATATTSVEAASTSFLAGSSSFSSSASAISSSATDTTKMEVTPAPTSFASMANNAPPSLKSPAREESLAKSPQQEKLTVNKTADTTAKTPEKATVAHQPLGFAAASTTATTPAVKSLGGVNPLNGTKEDAKDSTATETPKFSGAFGGRDKDISSTALSSNLSVKKPVNFSTSGPAFGSAFAANSLSFGAAAALKSSGPSFTELLEKAKKEEEEGKKHTKNGSGGGRVDDDAKDENDDDGGDEDGDDEDDGADSNAGDEDTKGIGFSEKKAAAPPTVDLQTGEEDDKTLFQTRCKLYRMNEAKEWKERGVGSLRVNVDVNNPTRGGRLIMRSEGVLKLILNVRILPKMPPHVFQERFVKFSSIEDGKLVSFLAKTSNANAASKLAEHIEVLQQQDEEPLGGEEPQEPRTNDSSEAV